MSKENKNLNKKPKFSPYWIYGLVIAAFFAVQIFSGGFGGEDAKTTTPSQFFEYLKNGDVAKVKIINDKEAKVYLTKEALETETHKGTKPNNIFPSVTPSPNYKFKFGDLALFQQEMRSIIEDNNLTNTEVEFETEHNVWGDFLLGLLPFILIIGVWIFIMRRMSGGGAGGAVLMTRLGRGSQMVITGDTRQSDRMVGNGLIDFKRQYENYFNAEYVKFVELGKMDIQRHPAVAEVLGIYGE